jgi:DNA replicative helicase MCM subunit Mcm2 (Cdc46/Mcm family)
VAAREMLNEFWVDLKLKGEDSNRSLNTILRIADAHAGLALKEVIDVEIAENDEGDCIFEWSAYQISFAAVESVICIIYVICEFNYVIFILVKAIR